jgi:hypothetical protein
MSTAHSSIESLKRAIDLGPHSAEVYTYIIAIVCSAIVHKLMYHEQGLCCVFGRMLCYSVTNSSSSVADSIQYVMLICSEICYVSLTYVCIYFALCKQQSETGAHSVESVTAAVMAAEVSQTVQASDVSLTHSTDNLIQARSNVHLLATAHIMLPSHIHAESSSSQMHCDKHVVMLL